MYTVRFYDCESRKTLTLQKMEVDPSLSYSFKAVMERMMILTNDKVDPKKVNVAYQVLLLYPKATNIEVLPPVSPFQIISLALIFLAFVLFGPIMLCLEMFGFPKGKSLFRKILDIPQFKKSRKVYLAITFTLYTGILVLFILSICLPALKNMITPSLYILFGFDIAIFVLAYFLGNNIYKKYYKEPDVKEVSDYSYLQTGGPEQETVSIEEKKQLVEKEKKPFKFAGWLFPVLGLVLSIPLLIAWIFIPYMEGEGVYTYYYVLSGQVGPSPVWMFIAFVVATLAMVLSLVLYFTNKNNHLLKMICGAVAFVGYIMSLVGYLVWVYESGILRFAYMTYVGDILYDVVDGILISVGLAELIAELVLHLKQLKKKNN